MNCVSFPPYVDELKHIIGAETTRKGILRVFEMFQHNQLNRRMVYVFLEGFLETLFPQYKFRELFNKLHSRSMQMQKYKQKLQTSQAPSLQKRWHSNLWSWCSFFPELKCGQIFWGLTHILLCLHQSLNVSNRSLIHPQNCGFFSSLSVIHHYQESCRVLNVLVHIFATLRGYCPHLKQERRLSLLF